MSEEQKKSVSEIFSMTTVTDYGLKEFRKILSDPCSLKTFLSNESAINFLDALYNTDKGMFIETLSMENVVCDLAENGKGQWVMDKLKSINNPTPPNTNDYQTSSEPM